MPFCTECGTNVLDDVRFCTECGKAMDEETTTPLEQPAPVAPSPVPIQQSQPQQNINSDVMSTLAYIGTFILFAIPIVGLIFAIIWSFNNSINRNRRNLSRAFLIFTIISIILTVILSIVFSAIIGSILNDLLDEFKSIPTIN